MIIRQGNTRSYNRRRRLYGLFQPSNISGIVANRRHTVQTQGTKGRNTQWDLFRNVPERIAALVAVSRGIGQFANEGYWSSLEDAPSTNPSAVSGQTSAWIVDFYDGQPYSVDKSNTYHVRPIRAITN